MNHDLSMGGETFALRHGKGGRPHRLDIVFTGSGSEYLRIWILNMLLMLVTP